MSESITTSPEATAPVAEAADTTAETTETVTTDNNGNPTETEMSYAGGKYKSVSELEKGYTELQSTFSKKMGAFKGAPESYELAEGIESNTRIDALQEWGKENQVSNEALNSIIAMDREATAKATEAYVAEQKELLGKDADTRLTNISDWARANAGEDMMDAFNGMITSAKGVELMEKLMKVSSGTAPAAAASPTTTHSRETLREMRFAKDANSGERRMSVDPQYRAKVEAAEAEFIASGGKLV